MKSFDGFIDGTFDQFPAFSLHDYSSRAWRRPWRWAALVAPVMALLSSPAFVTTCFARIAGGRSTYRRSIDRGDEDLCSIAQSVGAVDDDAIARRQARSDGDFAIILWTKRDLAL